MARPKKAAQAKTARQPRKSKSNGADEQLRLDIVRIFSYNTDAKVLFPIWNAAYDFVKGMEAPATVDVEFPVMPPPSGTAQSIEEPKNHEPIPIPDQHAPKSKFDTATLNL